MTAERPIDSAPDSKDKEPAPGSINEGVSLPVANAKTPASSVPNGKKAKKRRKAAFQLNQLGWRARRLISIGASNWKSADLAESYSIQESVRELLANSNPYESRRTDGFMRELLQMNELVRARFSQERRATDERHAHPDRNMVVVYNPPASRFTYASRRGR